MSKRCFVLLISLLSVLPHSELLAKESDTTRVMKMIDRAKEMQNRGRPDSAEHYFKLAGKLAEHIGYDNGILSFSGNYSVFLYEQLRYAEALEFARRSLQLSLRLGNLPRAAAAYNNISLQLQAQGKLEAAARHLVKGLEISLTIRKPTHRDLGDRRKYYNNLSSLMLDLYDLKKGLHYARESYGLAEELRDTLAMGRSLVNIVVAEAMAKDLDSAEVHAGQLLDIARFYGDVPMEIKAHNNLGDIYRMQGKLKQALNSFVRAQEKLSPAFPGNEVYVLSGLSRVYWDMGRLDSADKYFGKALELAKTELSKPQLLELYLSGADIKESLGNYRDALGLHKLYQALTDSVKAESTHRAIQELELKYRTLENGRSMVQKDLMIAKQRASLERKNKWIIISVSLVVLLGWVLISLRMVIRQKRKRLLADYERDLLEAQVKGEEKERGRTARELHDGVASILSAAKLHLFNSSDKHGDGHSFSDIADLIELAVNEIRTISHNLAPEFVLKEGLACAIDSFCHRIRKGGFPLDFYVVGEIPRFCKNAELVLYRTVQEAVNNIVKHASATEGLVQIESNGETLLITVEDNGKGFDPDYQESKGIGLDGLRDRISLLGGTVEIKSSLGMGTSVNIELAIGGHTI